MNIFSLCFLSKCPLFLLAGEHVVIFRFCVFAVSKCFGFIDVLCGECVSGSIHLSALFGYPLFLFDLCLKINWLFSLTEQHFTLKGQVVLLLFVLR